MSFVHSGLLVIPRRQSHPKKGSHSEVRKSQWFIVTCPPNPPKTHIVMQQLPKIHRFGTTQVSSCHPVVWGRHKACSGNTLLLSPRCTASATCLFLGGWKRLNSALCLLMASVCKLPQSAAVCLFVLSAIF